MRVKTYRGWYPVAGALVIGLVAFGLSLPGAPAGDDPVGPAEPGAAEAAATLDVDSSTPSPGMAVNRPLAVCYSATADSEPGPNSFKFGDNVRMALIKSSAAVAGVAIGGARAGGARVGEDCDCDDDCYGMGMKACDGGPNDGQGCTETSECLPDGVCVDLEDKNGCRVPQCVIDEDTGVASCQLEDGFVNARCDLDGLWCTVDLCQLDPDNDNEIYCEAQPDGAAGDLSPCAKACDGGTRDGMWCSRASDCPNGACVEKDNVTCDEMYDYCMLTDGKGRCCDDNGTGWPDECSLDTQANCDGAGGYWLRGQDPDDACVCPVYSSGVAPSGDHVINLGPVVPPAKRCGVPGVSGTGDRCEFAGVDCPMVCQEAPYDVICEDDDDCPGVVVCAQDGNDCVNDPAECHGVDVTDPDPDIFYFTYLGDDYAVADGNYLRLSEFRFRGGVENAGEALYFEFYTGVCDNGDPCVKDADCTSGTCGDPKLVDRFGVVFAQAGIRDYTIQIDCHPFCSEPNNERPDDPPMILPPVGWVVMRSYWGGNAANGHWVSTTAPPDVGNNDPALLWWQTTEPPSDPIHRGDYPGLDPDVLIFELVGQTVGDEEPQAPDGACCDDEGGCTDTLLWNCGRCLETGEPCSWSRDCGHGDDCTFINWQGPRAHDDYNIKVCYGGDEDGMGCDSTAVDCPGGTCVLSGERCAEKRCSEGGATSDDACAGDGGCDSGNCWGPCDAGGCCKEGLGCVLVERLDCHDPDHPTTPGDDEWLGYGTGCVPNCCSQPVTGADCACDYAYRECQNTSTLVFTGQPCDADDECDGHPDEACVDRSCTGPTLFQFTTMKYMIDDPGYATFSGDNSGAVFTWELGDECTLEETDPGWYEGFELIDDTEEDETDDCWVVTVDYCCNEPIKSPTWILLQSQCPCGEGGTGLIPMDTDEYGEPRGGYGWGCNADHCCDDQNFAATFTLGPGKYTWQMYGDLVCDGTVDECDSDEDCAQGVACVNSAGPYIGHFTVAPCTKAACCFDRCEEGSPNEGAFCDEASAEADCGDAAACRNECEVINRLWCEDPDGADGAWLGTGAVSQPVNTCVFTPCAIAGSCCQGPGDCNDSTTCDTEDECELTCSGEYKGGVTCDDDPCPVCTFSGTGYCHPDHPMGMMLPIDRSQDWRGADDFKPTVSSMITNICWEAGFVLFDDWNPTNTECGTSVLMQNNWEVVFYPEDPLNPGLPDVDSPLAPPQFISVDAREHQGGGSYVYDFQGHISPVGVNVGDCYWMELSADGGGFSESGDGCLVYWSIGLANDHCLRDLGNGFGTEDAYSYDFRFCLDSGIDANDCGEVRGACCVCPNPPDTYGDCYDNYLLSECEEDDYGDYWYPGTTCAVDTCPGNPANDECAAAVVVNPAEFAPTCTVSGGTCDLELQDCPPDEQCVEGKHYDLSTTLCCSTDGPSEGTNCFYDSGSDTYDLYYDVWYTVTAIESIDLVVSTCGLIDWDSLIAVYDASTAECATLTMDDDEIACDDSGCDEPFNEPGDPSRIPNDEYPNLNVPGGATVLVRVGTFAFGPDAGEAWDVGGGQILFYRGPPPDINAPEKCLEPHDRPKDRFLSFEANNPGVTCAIQVELTGLQKCCVAGKTACVTNDDCAAGDTCEDCVQCFEPEFEPYSDVGMKWWVSKPRCTDLAGAAVDPPCVEPNVWRAQLTVDPVCHGGGNNDLGCVVDDDCPDGLCGREEWVEDCIHIGDCEVIPLATYALRAALDPLGAPSFSTDLLVETIRKPGTKCWADLVGRWVASPGHWLVSDEVVNMDDVMAAVMYFKKHPNKPHRTWVEVNDLKPDMVLNMTDIQRIVKGFKGLPYPFENPAACPAGVFP